MNKKEQIKDILSLLVTHIKSCSSICLLDNEEYDSYDVLVLIS